MVNNGSRSRGPSGADGEQSRLTNVRQCPRFSHDACHASMWITGHWSSSGARFLVRDLLMDNPGRRSDENSCRRHKQAEVPEYAAAGEQSDRGDHQGNLQEDFAEIETVGFVSGEFAFLLQFAGLGVEFLLIVFIAICFGHVFFM